MESSIQVTRPCRLQEMENVEEWKEINWSYISSLYNNADLSGTTSTYLGEFIDRIPKDLWQTETKWKHNLLSLACSNGDEIAIIKLLPHCKYTVDNLSKHASSVIPSYPRLLEIFLSTGFEVEFNLDINDLARSCGRPNEYEPHIRNLLPKYEKCLRIIMSYGIRLDKASIRSVPRKFIKFENGLVVCRDVIVILLGLKKRQYEFLKRLDRFLIKQVLAVEIWATRTSDEWQEIKQE